MTTKNVIWMVSQVSDRNNHLAIAGTITTGGSYGSADNLQSVPSWATFDIGARYVTTLAGHPTTFRATVTNLLDKRYWVANPSGCAIRRGRRCCR